MLGSGVLGRGDMCGIHLVVNVRQKEEKLAGLVAKLGMMYDVHPRSMMIIWMVRHKLSTWKPEITVSILNARADLGRSCDDDHDAQRAA